MLRSLVDTAPDRIRAPRGDMRPLIDTLRLRYQRIVDLNRNCADAAEVLARQCIGAGVLAGPERILAAMTGPEESLSLTETILDRALGEISVTGLRNAGIGFAVNVPLNALLHPGLLEMIEAARLRHFVPAEQIRFELTEHQPVTNVPVVSAITKSLAQAGYGVALDDVTPQMPHLAEILALPLQAIKIDRSVVTNGSAAAKGFIRDIAAIGVASGAQVVAEGIETSQQLATIRELGVTHAQGYLFAKPLPAVALKHFLT